MKVYFIGAGPGDPELLTVKAQRLLQTARCCIFAGSLINPDLLRLLPADAERHDSAAMALDTIIARIEDAARRNMDVVRLHSGEPALYGAIGEQMAALDQRGIAYEIVPGISAFQAAAAALRRELTMPDVAQTVILTRTAGRTPMPAEQDLDRLAATRSTLCIYLSTPQVRAVAETLIRHYGADCPAAVLYHVSWPDQRLVTGALRDIADRAQAAGIEKTALIVVGWALAGNSGQASKLYDRHFSHGYRTAARAADA